ncbi:DUF2683 family protein [Candidatus Woesearchaeota archaeon]|nr:DUF2683 family protein [Candidatus Woesearchaeota archaeon]HIH38542.1 DUF2683 family protein [Candidatus Woesearchaeota archaeon]HIH48497.1 DUF2683 family protein [Candidatus Woesearchaeota archaeon]HIJ02746.1 DUF2683 family protein [Candidatus Woesearchaeota archaeon]
MVQAVINIDERTNRVLNIVKAKSNFFVWIIARMHHHDAQNSSV